MFGFKKKIVCDCNVNPMALYAPCNGELINLKKVEDKTFADGILGPGFAIRPTDGEFCSPVNGEITQIFETLHAFCIKAENGAEILVHIGIDTVNLQGAHFKAHKKEGQKVKKGELIISAKLDEIQKAGYKITTPIIVTNIDEFKNLNVEQNIISVVSGDLVAILEK